MWHITVMSHKNKYVGIFQKVHVVFMHLCIVMGRSMCITACMCIICLCVFMTWEYLCLRLCMTYVVVYMSICVSCVHECIWMCENMRLHVCDVWDCECVQVYANTCVSVNVCEWICECVSVHVKMCKSVYECRCKGMCACEPMWTYAGVVANSRTLPVNLEEDKKWKCWRSN